MDKNHLLFEYRKLIKSGLSDLSLNAYSSGELKRIFALARNLSIAGLVEESKQLVGGRFDLTYRRWDSAIDGLNIVDDYMKPMPVRPKMTIDGVTEGIYLNINGFPDNNRSSSIVQHNYIRYPCELSMLFDDTKSPNLEFGLSIEEALVLSILNFKRDLRALNKYFANVSGYGSRSLFFA